MPLYRKIEHEIVLQKAENSVTTASCTIEAAGKDASSVLPDGWHYFSTDDEAVATLGWPLNVPRKEDDRAGFLNYVRSPAFQTFVREFSRVHGHLPSVATEAAE